MQTDKTSILSLVFLLSSILFLIISCKKPQDTRQTMEVTVQTVQTRSDTSGVKRDTTVVPSIEKLEKGKAEVETRLEALLSLIEQKERSLLEREKGLLEQEASLKVRAENLTNKESRFWRQQMISWIVLVLGLGSIVFAFIIGRKKQKKFESDIEVETEEKSEVKAAGETEKRKEDIKAEEAKAESEVKEKDTGKEVEEKEAPKEKSESKTQPKKES